MARAQKKPQTIPVELRPVDSLRASPRNPKLHDETNVAAIRRLIEEFGFTNPVLACGDDIEAGHGRALAVQSIYRDGRLVHRPPGNAGPTIPPGTIPVIDCTGWSEAQKLAYIVADNQSTLMGGVDDKKLASIIIETRELGIDPTLLGFSTTEIKIIEARAAVEAGKTDPDEVPEPPKVAVTKPGDIWLIGNHRLICGDATKPEDVAVLLGKVKPHLMVTDPPYGVNYDATWRERAGVATMGKPRTGKVAGDDRSDWGEAWALFPGDAAYVWHGALHSGSVEASLLASGFDLRSQIVWAKTVMVMGRGDYHWQHEPCWYAVRKGSTGHWQGDRTKTTLWTLASPIHIMSGSKEDKTEHPTQKPVECMRRPIENNSSPGQAVYEPFAGSGTTVIAAEMTGRICLAIELSPNYCDVIVERWEKYTGKKATLESTGATFETVAAQRLPAGRPQPASAKPKAKKPRKAATPNPAAP